MALRAQLGRAAAPAPRHQFHPLPPSLPARLPRPTRPQLLNGKVSLSLSQRPRTATSNMTKEEFLAAVDKTKEYIQVGPFFLLVRQGRAATLRWMEAAGGW